MNINDPLSSAIRPLSPRLLGHAFAFLGGGGSAPQRNLTQEMLQTLAGYRATTPGYVNLQQTFNPQFDVLGLQSRARQLQGVPGQAPGTLALTTAARKADVTDVSKLGPSAAAAYLKAKPGLSTALGAVTKGLTPSPLLKQEQTLAQQQLAAGGKLTPEQQRAADQEAETGFAARGMSYGPQSLAASILNRDAVTQQKLAQAEQFAGNVQGQTQNQNDFSGRAAQIFSSTLGDPYQELLGRTSGAGGGGGGGGSSQQIGTGASYFDPTNAYAADVYNSNFNAQAAQNIANQNQTSALEAGGLGAAGATSAALLTALPALIASDKRLKKNIRPLGKTPSGIPMKTFNFKGDPRGRRYIGAIAQDVEKIAPHAVTRHPVTGHKMLDYRATDAPFMQVPTLYGKLAKAA